MIAGTAVTLPCGCAVVVGEEQYDAACEPHRAAQAQDRAAALREEAERVQALDVEEARLRERALTRHPASALGPAQYRGGPPTLLSSERYVGPAEQRATQAAAHESDREHEAELAARGRARSW